MRQSFFTTIIVLAQGALAAGLLAVASAALPAGPDDDFLAAREAFRTGNAARLDTYARRLKGHLLEPYPAYWQLRLKLKDAEPEAVRGFLQKYPDTLLADQMRGQWLKQLGKQGAWELFAEEYPKLSQEDPEITCYALQARLARLQDREALLEARRLWFTGRETPESCTPLFDALVAEELLTEEDVWARIRLALEAGRVTVAKQANRYLEKTQALRSFDTPGGSGQALDERLLDAIYDNPLRYLERRSADLKSRGERELALFALQRVVRSATYPALARYTAIKEHFPETDQGFFLGKLADQAARRFQPETLGWYREAAVRAPLSDEQLGWRVRSALRTKNWRDVISAVDSMSPREQRAPAWRYWKGRALKETGREAEAHAFFAPLSEEHHFYGQLASEEMGVVMSPPADSYKPGRSEIGEMRQLSGIRRSLALYRLNLRTEGAREWLWAIRKFDDQQLLAAAEVARQNELWDRAIHTADQTVQLHDFSLRFLAPYREALASATSELGLDEAWVYGLIRQESRFVASARSSAGASGLMQLMPATAQWVAKRLGMKEYRPSLVNQLDVNLRLGAYYLKHVLTTLDNQPVPASAAYNAGPGRARQWRADQPMEGAIYAETIPFGETRDYVKKVMSNAAYYASVFGQQFQSFKERLGIIPPPPASESPMEEEK